MSVLSRAELELVQEGVQIEGIYNMLVNGCWVDEDDQSCIISLEQIEFTGGLHDSYFKIILKQGEVLIESDSPWELEVLTEELKEIAIKKSVMMK